MTQWEIFQLTLNGEQPTSVSCIHFGKAEMAAKLSPSHVANYVLHSCQLCIILPNISSRYYLQAQFTCHDKFYGKYYGILHACVSSVYQALPPIFRVPGNEAIDNCVLSCALVYFISGLSADMGGIITT